MDRVRLGSSRLAGFDAFAGRLYGADDSETMIVGFDELADIGPDVTMVDGGFDPIHAGHVAYFAAAADLGLPVLCNVSGDDWVGLKHAPLLPQVERVQVLDAFRWIDWTHPSTRPTVDILRALRPRHYVKGSDWRNRLPEEELSVCGELGISVVFLDTVSNSSTAILRDYGRRDAS